MPIVKTGVRDSADHGTTLQQRLDIDRGVAAALGQEATHIIDAGAYRDADGQEVTIASDIRAAVMGTLSVDPGQTLNLPDDRPFDITSVTVGNHTTLAAAHALVRRGQRVLALVFGNGISPGGGFLTGARAQEEFICRSSALYATLAGDAMYSAHRQRPDYESSEWAILSPQVPVFRADDGSLLHEPWLCSFITCAAPVMSRVGPMRSAELLDARIARILQIAAAFRYDSLVLGAWGCGAFRNDGAATAAAFERHIQGPTAGCFRHIAFAVTDWSEERSRIGPFRDRFSEGDVDVTIPSTPARYQPPPTPSERPSIFVSHASEDRDQAIAVTEALEAAGAKVWLALRDIPTGANYATQIVEAIEASSIVVILLSPAAVASQHVTREMNIAIDLNRELAPFDLSASPDFMSSIPAAWRYWLSIVQVRPYLKAEQVPGEILS